MMAGSLRPVAACLSLAALYPLALFSVVPPLVSSHLVQGGGELIPSTTSATVTHAYRHDDDAGSLLVLVAGSNATHAPWIESVRDAQGNSWRPTRARYHGRTGDAEVWYAESARAGADAVSIRWSISGQSESDWIGEYTGLDPKSPPDLAIAVKQAARPYSTGATRQARAGDLVLAAYIDDGNANVIGVTDGETQRYNNTSRNNQQEQLVVGDRLAAAAGPQSGSWSASGDGAAALLLVGFKRANFLADVVDGISRQLILAPAALVGDLTGPLRRPPPLGRPPQGACPGNTGPPASVAGTRCSGTQTGREHPLEPRPGIQVGTNLPGPRPAVLTRAARPGQGPRRSVPARRPPLAPLAPLAPPARPAHPKTGGASPAPCRKVNPRV